MDSFLSSLLSYLLIYRYAALGVFVYLGAIGAPLPVNAMLLALGAFAGQGYFNIWVSLGVAAAGNVAGDLTAYGITRRYGNTIVSFLRLRRLPFFDALEREVRSDAAFTIFLTRFGSMMSPVTNVLAGMAGVPFLVFLPSDAAGNVLEPFGFLWIGYAAGIYWKNFSDVADIIGAIVAVASVMFIIVRMQRRFLRRVRADKARI